MLSNNGIHNSQLVFHLRNLINHPGAGGQNHAPAERKKTGPETGFTAHGRPLANSASCLTTGAERRGLALTDQPLICEDYAPNTHTQERAPTRP